MAHTGRLMGKNKAYSNVRELIPKRLKIYQRNDVPSDSFYARARFPPQKGYRVFSTKTSNEAEAIRFATNHYYDLAGRQSLNISTKVHSIQALMLEWLDYKKRLRRTQSTKEKTTYRTKYERFIKPFFDSLKDEHRLDDINKVTQEHIERYWDYRYNYWNQRHQQPHYIKSRYGNNRPKYMNAHRLSDKKPSYATLEIEAQMLRSFFNWCVKRGYVSSNNVPDVINPVKTKTVGDNYNTRGVFQEDEYRTIRKFIDDRCSNDAYMMRGRIVTSVHHTFKRERMRVFFFTVSAFGIRPSEAKALKFKHIKLINDRKHDMQYSVIDLTPEMTKANPDGTRKGRRVYSFDNELAYNRVHVRWKKVMQDTLGQANPEDYIFPKWIPLGKRKKINETEYADMGTAFRKVLIDCNMHIGKDGRPRSVYALRKFYITQRIKHGVPLPALALNTGNTIAVMWKHYVALTSDDMRDYLTRRNKESRRLEINELFGGEFID